jgi:hypothetical protein
MASEDNCRARAKECMEAAERAADPESKLVLLDLVQRWLWLAGRSRTIADQHELRGDILLDYRHTTR